MSFIAKTILTVLLLFYPVIVYFGISYYDVHFISIILLFVFLTKFLLERKFLKDHLETKQSVFTVIIAVLICLLTIYSRESTYLKYYPVCMNILFLVLFLYSLAYPPTMIEKFARLRHQNLNKHAINYLRKVTTLWCAFFIFNGTISAYTVLWGSLDVWALYNGLISYILMAGLFLGEFLYRKLIYKDGVLNE